MFKKLMAMFCVFVMVFSLCACGNNGASTTVEKKEITKLKELPGSLIVEDKMELTVFMRQAKTDDGRKPLLHDAAEMTNVLLTPTLANSNSNWKEAFNMMVASGEMPDMVMNYTEAVYNELGMQGAFLPLDVYMDEYAPDMAAFLNSRPDVKSQLTAPDGHIYYVCLVQAGVASYGWFARQDWLDKLNLEAPTNAEELYKVLTAFKTEDPNGNGKQDEVPYFAGGKLDALYPLWNTRNTWYTQDGKVIYGPGEENYKTAIQNLRKWYSEGLFDPEIMTRTSSSRDKMLMDDIGGMTHEWIGSTAAYNDKCRKTNPEFDFQPIAPPGGVEIHRRNSAVPYGWGINANSPNIAVALAYMNFWYTEEGSRLMNFGKEGVHYEMIDGKPTFKPEVLAQDNFLEKFKEYGAQDEWGFVQDWAYEEQWLNDIAIKGMDMYTEGNWFAEQYPRVELTFNKEEMEEYTALKTAIDTYTKEMEQKWILGSEDIDKTWDTYQAKLKSLNLARLQELNEIGYERMKDRG